MDIELFVFLDFKTLEYKKIVHNVPLYYGLFPTQKLN